MTSLAGRVALVTGAAQGMGAAHARRLASAGATVAVNDIRAGDALHALAQEIGGLTAPGDVSDPAVCRQIADDVAAATGRLDILVANHAYMTMAPLLDHDEGDWWRVVDTNLGGTFHLVQAVLPHMRRLGAGRIVVIASEWGVIGWPEATAYAAAKSGLISLVKSLGRELAPEHIIVNAVAPGVTDTRNCRSTPTPPGSTWRPYMRSTPRRFPWAASDLPTRSPRPWSSSPISNWKRLWDR